MIALSRLYHPVTATPFQHDQSYLEVAPCEALRPYIRCFWGSEGPAWNGGGMVIPDTCMDIICRIDRESGRVSSSFCTLDEQAYAGSGSPGCIAETFAIRFYPWSVGCFTPVPMNRLANQAYPADVFFPSLMRELEPMLLRTSTLQERIRQAEGMLLRQLQDRTDTEVLCALHRMLLCRGREKIAEISARQALSVRQLERRFDAALGLSPKAMAGLMRYQLLWQEMLLHPAMDVQDAVARYGYTDQAHLLRDFKRRHLMTPGQALRLAHKSVAFLQDPSRPDVLPSRGKEGFP